jgi:hypothetical protein
VGSINSRTPQVWGSPVGSNDDHALCCACSTGSSFASAQDLEEHHPFRGSVMAVPKQFAEAAWHLSIWKATEELCDDHDADISSFRAGRFLSRDALCRHLFILCKGDLNAIAAVCLQIKTARKAPIGIVPLTHMEAYALGWKGASEASFPCPRIETSVSPEQWTTDFDL